MRFCRRKQYRCWGCSSLLHIPFERSRHQSLIILNVRLLTLKFQAVRQSARQAKSLFNFPPQIHISSTLTHLKKSPVSQIHLPIHKSYNTGVCTYSQGNSSIRKAAKYQKYDAPHFSSTSAWSKTQTHYPNCTTIVQQCQEKFLKVLGNSEAPWQP